MRRLAAALVILLAPAVILGGAYAGEQLGGGEAGAEEIAAERAWTARVNALCRAQSAEFDRLRKPRTLRQLVVYVRRMKPISRRYDRLILATEVPPRFRADFVRIKRTIPETYRLFDATATAAKAGDRKRLAKLDARGRRLERKVGVWLKRLELDDC